MTYSIGFRAAPTQELATQFLVYLQDRICLEGRYADPELQRQSDPARISDEMVDKVSQMLSQISWDKQVVSDFLGHYLTEPKAHVFYDAPEDELDEDEFAAALGEKGIELDRKSLILFRHGMFYCNGELLEIEPDDVAVWQQFANQRRLSAADIRPSLLDQLYQGYLTGYWHFPQSVAK